MFNGQFASKHPLTEYIKSSLGLWGNDTLLYFTRHVKLCSFHHLQFRRFLQLLEQCLNMVEVIYRFQCGIISL